ncbi:MAG: CooT family nickel-binding protein [Chloroflexota bacterium]|nr:CooT family nickel-binding protein [Chloroflexota bacterium]
MCLAKAYLVKDSTKELVMEEVATIEVGQRKLVLRTIFGEQREMAARVKQIDFANSSIILEGEPAR